MYIKNVKSDCYVGTFDATPDGEAEYKNFLADFFKGTEVLRKRYRGFRRNNSYNRPGWNSNTTLKQDGFEFDVYAYSS